VIASVSAGALTKNVHRVEDTMDKITTIPCSVVRSHHRVRGQARWPVSGKVRRLHLASGRIRYRIRRQKRHYEFLD
jgi:hypothetical protein